MAPDASPAPVPPPAVELPAAASAAEALRPALLLWLATEILGGLVAQLTAFFWRRGEDSSMSFFMWLQELGGVGFAALVVYFTWPHRAARRVFARPRPRMVELCIVVGVAASLLLAMWERQIPDGWSSGSIIELEASVGWPMWACLLASAVMPAVFEELMYRGLLQQRLAQVAPIPLAIAIQAMLFAAMHLNPVYLLPHFVFGLIGGLLRVAAGALWPCILMHFLWNGSLVLWQYEWL